MFWFVQDVVESETTKLLDVSGIKPTWTNKSCWVVHMDDIDEIFYEILTISYHNGCMMKPYNDVEVCKNKLTWCKYLCFIVTSTRVNKNGL